LNGAQKHSAEPIPNPNPLRVGISTSVIQRGKTGVAQYVFALLHALLELPAKPHITAFVLQEDLLLFSEHARKGLEIVAVPEAFRPPVKNILWHQTRLPRIARRHRFDVIHIPSYRRMLWPKPCPLVATIHDLAPFRVAKKYDWKRMLYGKVVARRLAFRQDRIVAISQNTAGDLKRFFGLPTQRITVIHNGIDHRRFNTELRQEVGAKYRERQNLRLPFFLYTARLEHPGKNHLRLVTAFEQFKAATNSNWQLVFAGSDWHGAEVIHAAIQNSRFRADIRTLGFVPDAELPDLYKAADVFVYPSLYEGFGMPPLEAMACGCPVIASAAGSLAEVLGDAAAFVDPEELHAISRELFRLASDPAERNRLRAAGLNQAGKFDWARTAAATLEVYQSVIPERRPRAI